MKGSTFNTLVYKYVNKYSIVDIYTSVLSVEPFIGRLMFVLLYIIM